MLLTLLTGTYCDGSIYVPVSNIVKPAAREHRKAMMKKTLDRSAGRPARAVDRIRASASELFYREGIRAVGVDEVVDRAGVTKPSLYRSFASKDDLAAAYMRDYELDFWEKFEKPGGKSYSDAREHVLAYMRWLSARAVRKGYRGCGLSNATVEYPSRDNPARQVAEAHKKLFRKRLRELAAAMGARHPAVLGDALQLLIEGIYVTGQQSEEGPAQSAVTVAKLLIDVSVPKA